MTERRNDTDLDCAAVQEGLSAMLDDAVDALESAKLRRHVEGCSRCAEFDRSLRQLDKLTQSADLEECDEAAIWDRVQVAIAEDAESRTPVLPLRPSRPNFTATVMRWSAAAVVMFGLALGGLQMIKTPAGQGAILEETLADFATYQSTGEVLDLAATNPDAVLRWMLARVEFDLPEHIASPAGMSITGGRLCSFLNRHLAFFSYTANGGDVGLYIAKAEGLNVPKDGGFAVRIREDGLSAISWYQDGLAYAAVSRLPVGDLTDVANYLKNQGVRDL